MLISYPPKHTKEKERWCLSKDPLSPRLGPCENKKQDLVTFDCLKVGGCPEWGEALKNGFRN